MKGQFKEVNEKNKLGFVTDNSRIDYRGEEIFKFHQNHPN